MAVRDGVSAHFVWGNSFYAYSKNSSEGPNHCFLLNNSVNMTTSFWKPCG